MRSEDLCPFCEVAHSGVDCHYIERYGDNSDRRLRSSDLFFTINSLSPVAETHLLVCTTSHITAVLPSRKKEFFQHVNDNDDLFPSTGCFFEHGLLHPDRQACGISHAHVHYVNNSFPSIFDRTDGFIKRQASDLKASEDEPWARSSAAKQQVLEYISIFDRCGRQVFFAPQRQERIESQFMRKVVGEINNFPWNWREV